MNNLNHKVLIPETIFKAKPDLREDDKEIINFLLANGGQAYESELRKKFLQPRTTMWRAVKRLERQGIIEIEKKDLQNIVKLKSKLEDRLMNKPLVFFSLFLVASMGFVTIPNTVHADSQLDILIKITQNAKEHIKNDIDKLSDISQEVYDFYDDGARQTVLLIQAAEKEDVVSARQHFISAMIAFKQTSLAISENELQKTPQTIISDQSQTIKKYENNIKKLKLVSAKLNTDIDFEQIDQLLALAKANYAKGNLKQTEEVLSKIASDGKQIQKLLYEISEQNRIHKAKQFVQKHAERINNLILQAKTFGLDKHC